ncbi:radical SAM protein [Nannocystis sp. RBIL2]|uniref:radical SAM protein n=1 Tax=Nannocystis sp. RBIL2 TaxID=2996788 RepID=UPI002270C953|nr:radical SAM protein [Nannocystis sp. RBIL2]
MTALVKARDLVRLGVARAVGRALPFSVTFILTHRCNFRCEYCEIPERAAEEMSDAEFCAAIDELRAAGMARASFSGGEVLLRRDAPRIVGHAKRAGCFTSMNTNGWRTGNVLRDMSGLLDMVVLSLDGPEPVHDLVRRRPGSYARVIAAIEQARGLGMSVATITVVGPWNVARIEEIAELAGSLGVWAYFQPAHEECFDAEAGLHPALTPAVLAEVADRLERLRARGLPLGASPGFLRRLRRAPRFHDCAACHAGRYFATVMPEGWVVPCHLTSGTGKYLNGREVGFARAFFEMPHPQAGDGCAISPYVETDLIFRLDPRAIAAALRRGDGAPGRAGG